MSDELEVTRLRAEIASADPARRLAAAEKLLISGEIARGLAPELLAACATEDDALREVVMGAIEGMGAPEVLRAREIGAFLDGDETQAYWAAILLGRLGREAAFAVAGLAKVLAESPSEAVRERCAWALGQIGPDAKGAKSALERAAASSSPRLARFAREAITAIGGN